MAWMFQVNPRRFDIDGAMGTDRPLRWALRQHARDVEVGDPAVIWRSGPDRGVIAAGSVIRVTPDKPEVADWEREFELEPFDPVKRLTIAELDVQPVRTVRGDHLKQHSELRGLLILRRPNATVFRIREEEWDALSPLLERVDRRE